MAVNVGDIVARLMLNSKPFTQGLGRARDENGRFVAGAKKQFAGFEVSAKAAFAAASAAATAFGAAVLKVAGDFEESMKGVQAVSGLAGKDLDRLRRSALDMGRDTRYSATEASNALETLARNGLKGADTLIAASEAALNLAAATGTDIATAADIATDAMAQFGFEASQLTNVIDQITQTTKESKFGIQDYFGALGAGGGSAGKLGVEFEEFNAVLAATSSSFKSGRDAGTSLKTFITSLAPTTGPAQKAIKDLNLEFFDLATGEMKSMPAIAQELQDAFKGLTEQQRIQYAGLIFGSDAQRTALSLYEMGGEKIADYVQRIKTQGNAQKDAAIRMEGFNGAMRELASATENLMIAMGDTGFLAMGEQIVDWASAAIRYFGELTVAVTGVGSGFAEFLAPALKETNSLVESTKKGVNGLLVPFRFLLGLIQQAAAGLKLMNSITNGDLSGTLSALGDFKSASGMSGLKPEMFADEGFAEGGVFSAPKSGKLFIGHGNEAVVPLDGGMDKAFLRFMEILGVPGFEFGGMTANAKPRMPGPWSVGASAEGVEFSKKSTLDKIADMLIEKALSTALGGKTIASDIISDTANRMAQDVGDAVNMRFIKDQGMNQSQTDQFSFLSNLPSLLNDTFAGASDVIMGGVQGLRESFGEDEIERAARFYADALEKSAQAGEEWDREFSAWSESFANSSGTIFDTGPSSRDFAASDQQAAVDYSSAIARGDVIPSVDRMQSDTGARVDIQSAMELVYGLGGGSNGTGAGVIRQEGPSSFSGQIADLIAKANKGAFLDVKQAGLDMFKGVLSDDLIRSVVDQAVSKANAQGAGTGGDVATFVKNQRMIQEVVTELGRLALGSDGLRKAQMDLQLSAHTGATQLDIFKERMGLLAGGVEVSANAMKAEAEARVNSTETMGRNTLSQNDRLMEMAAASDRAKESLSGFAMGAAAAQGVSMAGGGAKHQLMIGGMASNGPTVTINVGGSVVTERQLANVILTHVQRDSRGSIGTGTI